MLKKGFILIIFLILIFISGCSAIRDSNLNDTDIQTNTSEKLGLELKYLNLFKEAFPKAEIVGKVMLDVNNDKEEYLVVIFNNPTETNKIIKSNIAFITKDDIKALDLASGNLNFQFANGSESLKKLENPNRVSVMMYNTEMNKTIDYQVTVTIDKELNKTNYKIETID